MPKVLPLWSIVGSIPLIGKWLFSFFVSWISPYTCSIPIRFQNIKPFECTATCKQRFSIQNPFNSIHAAALVNLGEATTALALLSGLEVYAPPEMKAIPTKIEAIYLKKARGLITAMCDVRSLFLQNETGESKFRTLKKQEMEDGVPLLSELKTSDGTLVATVKVTWVFHEASKKK